MNSILKKTVLAITGVLLMASSSAASPMLPNFVPLAKQAGPAVVNISTEKEVDRPVMGMFGFPGMEQFFEQFGGPFGARPGQPMPKRKSSALGSGFIISSDGYIVTNNHVVEGADKITVKLNGDKSAGLSATLVGTDAETDLALLKVESSSSLPVLKFGDSEAMEVGDWVVAIGNPFGLSNTVTAGILSAKGRDIHAGPFDNFLQTDASINPGNSGGPLINMNGEVIGINTAISASGQGIGFAIPSSLASKVINDLRDGKKVSRGWLGVTIQDVDENMSKALGLKNAKGALIGSVLDDEPAAKAGLRAGDVIIRVGQNDIDSASALTRTVAGLKPGSKADIVVLRDGKEVKCTVLLGERSSHSISEQNSGQQKEGGDLGISLKQLTPEDAKALQLSGNVKGLLVVAVKNSGPAAEAGIRTGDVILSANLKAVSSVDELVSIVHKEGRERGAVMLQINRRGETFFMTVTLNKK